MAQPTEPVWLVDEQEIPTATDSALRRSLITGDGRGYNLKTKALDELLRRARVLESQPKAPDEQR